MKVAIIIGSKSDADKLKNTTKALNEFGINYKAFVMSAHRIPEELTKTLIELENDGVEVIIAAAGLAAHLPGVIASKTILPVIGLPINAALDGLDSLLSIVQMPPSFPVATVGIDAGYNAGMLATEILAIKYPLLKEKLINYREQLKNKLINEKNIEI